MLTVRALTILFSLATAASFGWANDIAVSGFNEDVVTENGAPGYAHKFDIAGSSWIEDGLQFGRAYDGTTITTGNFTGIGLPPSGVITSATGSGVVYHLRPYDQNNVLRMGDNDPFTGTMTVLPGTYSALHILAASGTAGPPASTLSQLSDIVFNFTDGSVRLPNALLAHDWDAHDNPPPPNSVVIGGLDRNVLLASSSNGPNVLDRRHHFALYETALDLDQMGLSGRVLQSITFSDTTTLQATGVFAVDGTPAVPEPGTLGLFGVTAIGLRRKRETECD